MQLSSQTKNLGDTLDKMERQEARLNRKIHILDNEHTCYLIMISDTRQVIMQADYDASKYDQNQLVVLMDQVEAKTRKANLSRAKAYELALSGIDNRTHGNRTRANQELRKVERWIEEAIMLDEEIVEHSSQLMRLNKRIEVAEHQGRRAKAVKKDLEYDIIGIQYKLFTARHHREELNRSFEGNRKLFLQLRDECKRFELVTISESDEADDLRNQAEAAERSTEGARKELDTLLGRWVNDCSGTSEGDASVGELRVPQDLQLRSVVEEGLTPPTRRGGMNFIRSYMRMFQSSVFFFAM